MPSPQPSTETYAARINGSYDQKGIVETTEEMVKNLPAEEQSEVLAQVYNQIMTPGKRELFLSTLRKLLTSENYQKLLAKLGKSSLTAGSRGAEELKVDLANYKNRVRQDLEALKKLIFGARQLDAQVCGWADGQIKNYEDRLKRAIDILDKEDLSIPEKRRAIAEFNSVMRLAGSLLVRAEAYQEAKQQIAALQKYLPGVKDRSAKKQYQLALRKLSTYEAHLREGDLEAAAKDFGQAKRAISLAGNAEKRSNLQAAYRQVEGNFSRFEAISALANLGVSAEKYQKQLTALKQLCQLQILSPRQKQQLSESTKALDQYLLLARAYQLSKQMENVKFRPDLAAMAARVNAELTFAYTQYKTSGAISESDLSNFEKNLLPMAAALILFNQHGNGEFYTLIRGDQKVPQEKFIRAMVTIKKAIDQNKLSDEARKELDYVSQNLVPLIERSINRQFGKALGEIRGQLQLFNEVGGTQQAKEGMMLRSAGSGGLAPRSYAALLNQRDNNEAGTKINRYRADEILLTQNADTLKKQDPEAYRNYQTHRDRLIRELVTLENCQTIGDLSHAVALVQLLQQRGELPEELSGTKAQDAFLKRVMEHPVIKNAKLDLKLGEGILIAKKTAAAIAVTIAAATIGRIMGGMTVRALGSRILLGGFTRFILQEAISAPLFSLANRTLSVHAGLETKPFMSFGEFGADSVHNFGLFLVAGGASRAYQGIGNAILRGAKPATTFGKISYHFGAITTDVSALSGYSVSGEAIKSYVKNEKLNIHLGSIIGENAIFALGLKGAHWLAVPILTPLERLVVMRTDRQLLSRLDTNSRQAQSLLERLARHHETNGSAADYQAIRQEQASCANERATLLRRLGNLGIVEEGLVREAERMAAELQNQSPVVENGPAAQSGGGMVSLRAGRLKPIQTEVDPLGRMLVSDQVPRGEVAAKKGEAEVVVLLDRFANKPAFEKYMEENCYADYPNKAEIKAALANETEHKRVLQSKYPGKAVFEAESLDKTHSLWNAFQKKASPEREQINDYLKKASIANPEGADPEVLLKLAPELKTFFPRSEVAKKLVEFSIGLETMRFMVKNADYFNGAKPEWIKGLTLEAGDRLTWAIRAERENGRLVNAVTVNAVTEEGRVDVGRLFTIDGGLYYLDKGENGYKLFKVSNINDGKPVPAGEGQSIPDIIPHGKNILIEGKTSRLRSYILGNERRFTIDPIGSESREQVREATQAGGSSADRTNASGPTIYIMEKDGSRIIELGSQKIEIIRQGERIFVTRARANQREAIHGGAMLEDGASVTIPGVSNILISRRGDIIGLKRVESAKQPVPKQEVVPRGGQIEFGSPKTDITVPNGINGKPIDRENYVEVVVDSIKHGDINPGDKFVLGKPETYDRENATVDTRPTSLTYSILVKARELAINFKGSKKELADKIADMVDQNYSPNQDQVGGKPGEVKTFGEFQKNGGCCRHRATTLQLALQEAGISSRYVKGLMLGGGRHQWVEIAPNNDGNYSYVIDPNLKNRGMVDNSPRFKDLLGPGFYKAGGLGYRPDGKGMLVWRPIENVSGEAKKAAR